MSVKSGFIKVVEAVASNAPVRDSVLAAFAAAVGVAAGGGEAAQVALIAAAYGVLRAGAAFVAGFIVRKAGDAGK